MENVKIFEFEGSNFSLRSFRVEPVEDGAGVRNVVGVDKWEIDEAFIDAIIECKGFLFIKQVPLKKKTIVKKWFN